MAFLTSNSNKLSSLKSKLGVLHTALIQKGLPGFSRVGPTKAGASRIPSGTPVDLTKIKLLDKSPNSQKAGGRATRGALRRTIQLNGRSVEQTRASTKDPWHNVKKPGMPAQEDEQAQQQPAAVDPNAPLPLSGLTPAEMETAKQLKEKDDAGHVLNKKEEATLHKITDRHEERKGTKNQALDGIKNAIQGLKDKFAKKEATEEKKDASPIKDAGGGIRHFTDALAAKLKGRNLSKRDRILAEMNLKALGTLNEAMPGLDMKSKMLMTSVLNQVASGTYDAKEFYNTAAQFGITPQNQARKKEEELHQVSLRLNLTNDTKEFRELKQRKAMLEVQLHNLESNSSNLELDKVNAQLGDLKIDQARIASDFGEDSEEHKKISTQIKALEIHRKEVEEDGEYNQSNSLIDEHGKLEEKLMSQGTLSEDEFKRFNELDKKIKGMERKVGEIATQRYKDMQEAEVNKYKQTVQDKIKAGNIDQKPINQVHLPATDIKQTQEVFDKDFETFMNIRYRKKMTPEEFKKQNRTTMDTLFSSFELDIPHGAKFDELRGTVTVPFDMKYATKIRDMTKNMEKLGMQPNNYMTYSIDRTDGIKITVKKADNKPDAWEIRPFPAKTMVETGNELRKKYQASIDNGKRASYVVRYGDNMEFKHDAADPDSSYLTIEQGGMRSGKGANTGMIINQALASANGDVVKMFMFDHTGKMWNDMAKDNPKVKENLVSTGIMGVDGVTDHDLASLQPEEQKVAITKYVDNIVNSYYKIFAERDALLDHYKKGNVEELEHQVPQASFHIDEAEVLESQILTNPSMSKNEKDAVLDKLAGFMTSLSTVGLKRGISARIILQSGFKSKQLQSITRSGKPFNVISLDGGVDPKSFALARGWKRAVTSAKRGSPVCVKNGRSYDMPPEPIQIGFPGVGSQHAISDAIQSREKTTEKSLDVLRYKISTLQKSFKK